MSQARHRFVVIENLTDIAAAYGDGAAGRIVAQTAERIESAVGSTAFEVTPEAWGVCIETSAHSWTSSADTALEAGVHLSARLPYRLSQGQIVVALHATSIIPTGQDRLTLAAHLPLAQYRSAMAAAALAYSSLANGKLHFVEQPIRGARNTETVLYNECLVRLEGEGGQVILPSAYIGAVEELGLTRAFDRSVIEATINQLHMRPGAVLGCNVSSSSASLDSWWRTVFPYLARQDAVAERLVLEFTETARARSAVEMSSLLEHVRSTGCRIALDDFGAGYSSVGLIRDVSFDIVKIDGSYIRNRRAGDGPAALLNHLVNLARDVAAEVVVEGIENDADQLAATMTGARWLQGYHLGRPTYASTSSSVQALAEFGI